MNGESGSFTNLLYIIFTAVNVYLAIINWRLDNTPDYLYHLFFAVLFGTSTLLGIKNGSRD